MPPPTFPVPVRARITASILAALATVTGVGKVIAPGLASEADELDAAAQRDQGLATLRLFSAPDQTASREEPLHDIDVLTADYEVHVELPAIIPARDGETTPRTHEALAADLCASIYQLYATTSDPWNDGTSLVRRTDLIGGLGGLYLDEQGTLFSVHAFQVTYAVRRGDPYTPA
jgi:hypothetical protein